MDLYSLSTYDYELPEELVAQHPVSPRDLSKLMLVEKATGTISEARFLDLPDILNQNDALIFNNTKVAPARFLGCRRGGGKAEILLLKSCGDGSWEALVRPGRKLQPGAIIQISNELSCEVLEICREGMRRVRFITQGDEHSLLQQYGKMPLPHYIRGGEEEVADKKDYQTIYAKEVGAVAAPTAGLHFTDDVFKRLQDKGIEKHFLTLHVAMGTFKPVQMEDIRNHIMHEEVAILSKETAEFLQSNKQKGRRICVGTTSCRTLESFTDEELHIHYGIRNTNIFIYPGYRFKSVEGLLTNFHLPRSSLLMLVSAFGGYELIKEAYQKAIERRFRFFSYGDAMLIL